MWGNAYISPLLSCPCFRDARTNLRPLRNPHRNPCFDDTLLSQLITYLRSAGLGFARDLRDVILNEDPEIEDLDVGPIGNLTPDLDL